MDSEETRENRDLHLKHCSQLITEYIAEQCVPLYCTCSILKMQNIAEKQIHTFCDSK